MLAATDPGLEIKIFGETVITGQSRGTDMKTLSSSIVVCNMLVAGLLVGNTASAAEICEFIGRCDNGCYTNTAKTETIPSTIEATCDSVALALESGGAYVSYKVPLSVAPTPLSLECAKSSGNFYCEAWPQSESITYSWSATGSFVADAGGGTANPVRGFACTAGAQGTVTVTAYAPSGASSTLTKTVTCPSTP